MSDKKQKKRSEMTEEERESYDKKTNEFIKSSQEIGNVSKEFKELTEHKKKEGMLEHYGCLGTVVLVLLVLALLKFLL